MRPFTCSSTLEIWRELLNGIPLILPKRSIDLSTVAQQIGFDHSKSQDLGHNRKKKIITNLSSNKLHIAEFGIGTLHPDIAGRGGQSTGPKAQDHQHTRTPTERLHDDEKQKFRKIVESLLKNWFLWWQIFPGGSPLSWTLQTAGKGKESVPDKKEVSFGAG